jgi:two-component system LytT family response regulator
MTPRPWRVVIVDDEPPARRTLELLLEPYPGFQIADQCDHAAAAVESIRRNEPDVLFVDVQMPGATGLDVIRETGVGVVPVVVFTTAFAEYALPAFEAQALDYLLKPFSDERFDAVMRRVTRSLEQARAVTIERDRALKIRDAGRTYVIPVREIDWIEAEDYCARIHAGDRNVLVRRSLQSFAGELAADGFIRVHRSSIVNVARVREVQPLASGDQQIVLESGAFVRLSRHYREGFLAGLAVRTAR